MTAAVFAMTLALTVPSGPSEIDKEAAATFRTIVKWYGTTKPGVYREKIVGDKKMPETAFCWPYGVLLAALAKGCEVDRKTYEPHLRSALTRLEAYWTPGAPGGYSVLPGQEKSPDRYYDDNAWLALHWLEAYAATKDKRYLKPARRAMDFAIAGEDKKLGGGIYWREKEKTSKNTCINAPVAMVGFLWKQKTGEDRYVAVAERTLKWLDRLVDKDGLAFDSVALNGKIEKTKWTYNSACFALAHLYRFRVSGDSKSLDKALKTLDSALKRWVDPQSGAVNDPGYFAMHLVDALYAASELTGESYYADAADQIVGALHRWRDDRGLVAERWNAAPKQGATLSLHTQASVLRAYTSFLAARQKASDSKSGS